MSVWVVVTYHGSAGDDVAAFAHQESAEAHALRYAHDKWPQHIGPKPSSYREAVELWDEHALWGSFDSRWELVELPVQ